MWPQDLPPGSCVVLSGADDLCCAEEAQKVCQQAGIKVSWGGSWRRCWCCSKAPRMCFWGTRQRVMLTQSDRSDGNPPSHARHTDTHAQVIVNPALFHGAFLLSTAHKAHLMAEVAGLLATSGSLLMAMARPVLRHTLSAAHSLLSHVDTLTTR
jgi:hypothetical protein